MATPAADARGIDNKALILDLLEWLREHPRGYPEVLEAWRSTCPRLTVWEDAVDAGLVRVHPGGGPPPEVRITPRGRDFLAASGR